ncbi:MAG: WhiB family transcriptional regulator [Geodermatophilaceae bacterium]|nr:WhiB family transcriptional regulator [Geodermatophilaceae bacterium]
MHPAPHIPPFVHPGARPASRSTAPAPKEVIPVTVATIPDAGPDQYRPRSSGQPCELPCRVEDPDLWFAERPSELELAKSFCAPCPLREQCLTGALDRREPWGVWGGEIFEHGRVIARKRPRGRPRKDVAA